MAGMTPREPTILDMWGDEWIIREQREKDGLPTIYLGRPVDADGPMGAKAIITEELAAFLEDHRDEPAKLSVLPIGRSTIKRMRKLLGHHWQTDRAAWWSDRMDDLLTLTLEDFCRRHQVNMGSASIARQALIGPSLRSANWWREPAVADVLISDRPRALIADELGISVGAVGRLRWALQARPMSTGGRPQNSKNGRRITPDRLRKAATMIADGMSLNEVARALGVTASALAYRARKGDLPKSKYEMPRKGKTHPKPNVGYGPEMPERARAMVESGRSKADVAREMDIAYSTVIRWCSSPAQA